MLHNNNNNNKPLQQKKSSIELRYHSGNRKRTSPIELSFLFCYIKIDSKFGAFERSNRICASKNTYSMSSMIVAKKLMQKRPAGIIITTNMHADNACCVQYLVLAPKLQYKYYCNNK